MAHAVPDKKESVPGAPAPGTGGVRGWLKLAFFSLLIWFFGAVAGPWIQEHVSPFDEIVQVIEEQDIDSGAYFYTEIEAGFDGERYLRESFALADRGDFGWTAPFLSGVAICILLLVLGFRYLPND